MDRDPFDTLWEVQVLTERGTTSTTMSAHTAPSAILYLLQAILTSSPAPSPINAS